MKGILLSRSAHFAYLPMCFTLTSQYHLTCVQGLSSKGPGVGLRFLIENLQMEVLNVLEVKEQVVLEEVAKEFVVLATVVLVAYQTSDGKELKW